MTQSRLYTIYIIHIPISLSIYTPISIPIHIYIYLSMTVSKKSLTATPCAHRAMRPCAHHCAHRGCHQVRTKSVPPPTHHCAHHCLLAYPTAPWCAPQPFAQLSLSRKRTQTVGHSRRDPCAHHVWTSPCAHGTGGPCASEGF